MKSKNQIIADQYKRRLDRLQLEIANDQLRDGRASLYILGGFFRVNVDEGEIDMAYQVELDNIHVELDRMLMREEISEEDHWEITESLD